MHRPEPVSNHGQDNTKPVGNETRAWAEQLSAGTPARTLRILEGIEPAPADLSPATLAALRMLWIRHGSPGATTDLSHLLPEF